MRRITYSDLRKLFIAHESSHPTQPVTGHIVFTEDSFMDPYSEKSRTYVVSSRNKAFMPNMGGYSIFARCLDGTDPCVRLEGYMAAEYGGEKGWKVDYCYLAAEAEQEAVGG